MLLTKENYIPPDFYVKKAKVKHWNFKELRLKKITLLNFKIVPNVTKTSTGSALTPEADVLGSRRELLQAPFPYILLHTPEIRSRTLALPLSATFSRNGLIPVKIACYVLRSG